MAPSVLEEMYKPRIIKARSPRKCPFPQQSSSSSFQMHHQQPIRGHPFTPSRNIMAHLSNPPNHGGLYHDELMDVQSFSHV